MASVNKANRQCTHCQKTAGEYLSPSDHSTSSEVDADDTKKLRRCAECHIALYCSVACLVSDSGIDITLLL